MKIQCCQVSAGVCPLFYVSCVQYKKISREGARFQEKRGQKYCTSQIEEIVLIKIVEMTVQMPCFVYVASQVRNVSYSIHCLYWPSHHVI